MQETPHKETQKPFVFSHSTRSKRDDSEAQIIPGNKKEKNGQFSGNNAASHLNSTNSSIN